MYENWTENKKAALLAIVPVVGVRGGGQPVFSDSGECGPVVLHPQ